MDALCAKDRAPEGAQRFRIGNLHKRALTEPDATTADSPCPRAPFLPNRRRHRRCYGHMAGELGVAQFEMLMRKQYLEPNDQGLQLTHAGRKWTEQLGLEVSKKSTARFAYPCMDWSERKDHLAGSLAKALLELYVAKNWLRAPKESRALELTYLGQQALMPLLKST